MDLLSREMTRRANDAFALEQYKYARQWYQRACIEAQELFKRAARNEHLVRVGPVSPFSSYPLPT